MHCFTRTHFCSFAKFIKSGNMKSAESLGFSTLEVRSWRFSICEVWVAFKFRVTTLEYVNSGIIMHFYMEIAASIVSDDGIFLSDFNLPEAFLKA